MAPPLPLAVLQMSSVFVYTLVSTRCRKTDGSPSFVLIVLVAKFGFQL